MCIRDRVLISYALGGMILAVLFLLTTSSIEIPKNTVQRTVKRSLGLHRSRGVVLRLSGLFALDAFGGGLVVQSMVCLLYTSDAADEEDSVDLGGRRIIK